MSRVLAVVAGVVILLVALPLLYVDSLADPRATVARDYLAGRGFGPAEIAEFNIGYTPDSWDTLAGVLPGGDGLNGRRRLI